MVGLTLAIGDFMLLLIAAMAWTALGFAGLALLGAGTLGGLAVLARRWWVRH